MASADKTAADQPKHGAEHLAPHKFKPGQSGNPKGRPKGARSRLSEDFIAGLAQIYEEEGLDAIRRVAISDPDKFLSHVGRLVPKEFDLDVSGTLAIPSEIKLISVKPDECGED